MLWTEGTMIEKELYRVARKEHRMQYQARWRASSQGDAALTPR